VVCEKVGSDSRRLIITARLLAAVGPSRYNDVGHAEEWGVQPADDREAERIAFQTWTIEPDQLAPQMRGHWHLGEQVNWLPPREELVRDLPNNLLKGWLPEQPIITPDTRVLAMGSCFAANFIGWLAENGFNQKVERSPYDLLMRYGASFESVPVLAQQLRWAFDEVDPRNILWVDRDQQRVNATAEQQATLRAQLTAADVLIVTLGLSEVWYDRATGEPLWRAVPERYFDADRHAFKVLSMADTLACLEEMLRIRDQHLPGLKILFTVSPVRLRASFRPISAITANSVSKSILRAALDELLRNHADVVNRSLFYFPSFEIVKELLNSPYEADAEHVSPAATRLVLATFARWYTTMPAEEVEVPDPDAVLVERITELERRNSELQRICDERLAVIQELDQAAKERLAIIQALQAKG
jgi:hypothetical protein